jgi:hypothetical protein
VVLLGHCAQDQADDPPSPPSQVLDSSLEAHVLRSDSSSLANDCRKEIKALTQQLAKLEGWKKAERRQVGAGLLVHATEYLALAAACLLQLLATALPELATFNVFCLLCLL